MGDYEVERADLTQDRQAILRLWERNFPGHDAASHRSRFAWYYLENPCGPGRCWLLRAPDGRVVGTAGLGLRRVKMGDQIKLAGIASDFAVDAEHRTLLPALMLQRAVLEELEDDLAFIYGLPNSKSIGIFRRLGYECPASFSRRVKVLRVRRYLQPVPVFSLLAPVVSPVADWALRLCSRENWTPRRHTIVEDLEEFDGRFDELWERAAGAFELVGERTAEFLHWRYARCPLRSYCTLGLLRPGGQELLGYAIYFIDRDGQAVVADFFHEEQEGVVESLLAGLVDSTRRRGAGSICFETLSPGRLEHALGAFRFVERPQDWTLMVSPIVSLHRLGSHAPDAQAIGQWHFMRGDEDYN